MRLTKWQTENGKMLKAVEDRYKDRIRRAKERIAHLKECPSIPAQESFIGFWEIVIQHYEEKLQGIKHTAKRTPQTENAIRELRDYLPR